MIEITTSLAINLKLTREKYISPAVLSYRRT